MRLLMWSVVTLAIWPWSATAQDMIEPDRPDVTNGANPVGVGVVQLELGGIYMRESTHRHGSGSPVSLRIGVRDWLEARASIEGWVRSVEADAGVGGIGNVQLGAKIRVWPDSGGRSRLSLSPQVNLGTASVEKGLGTGQSDYVLAALTGFDVGPHAHLDVNYTIGAIGSQEGEPRFVQHLVSASLSVAAGNQWSPYYEMFIISRDHADGTPIVAINTGTLYFVSPRLALDGGVQFGLSEDAPAFAAFAGLSIAIGGSQHRDTSPQTERCLTRQRATSASMFRDRD